MAAMAKVSAAGNRRSKIVNGILINGSLALICLLWLIPLLGLLVSSFRDRSDIISSGWWTVFPHQEYVRANQVQLTKGLPLDQPIQVEGVTVTDDQLRAGYTLPDGRRLIWANRRSRIVDVQTQQWTSNANFTLSNYQNVLFGQQFTVNLPDGTTRTEQGEDMSKAFLNSLTVTIPATVIPILLATFAAYAFAWMRFPGRKLLFAMVVGLLVIPSQVALIPLLRAFSGLQMNGTFLALWLVHTGFGLSLAIFLRLILPLSVPALASFAIFQFMWVWNDYLNALIFLGTTPEQQVMTIKLAQMLGSRGQAWYLLTAGGFVSMLLPLVVFFSLQRFFVRGLLAGSVKG